MATVNRVIGGSAKVREATMQRVLEAARTIGFYGLGALQHRVGAARERHRLAVIIQTPHRHFCDAVASSLEHASADSSTAEVRPHVEALDDLSPESVAARMLALGAENEALAVIAAEHPIVSDAIDRLAANGVPVIALDSPLAARATVGYVGLDSWKVGRQAAWAFEHLCRTPGKLGTEQAAKPPRLAAPHHADPVDGKAIRKERKADHGYHWCAAINPLGILGGHYRLDLGPRWRAAGEQEQYHATPDSARPRFA